MINIEDFRQGLPGNSFRAGAWSQKPLNFNDFAVMSGLKIEVFGPFQHVFVHMRQN